MFTCLPNTHSVAHGIIIIGNKMNDIIVIIWEITMITCMVRCTMSCNAIIMENSCFNNSLDQHDQPSFDNWDRYEWYPSIHQYRMGSNNSLTNIRRIKYPSMLTNYLSRSSSWYWSQHFVGSVDIRHDMVSEVIDHLRLLQ